MEKILIVLFAGILSTSMFSQKAVFYQTAKTFSYGPRFGLNTSTLFFDDDEVTAEQGIRLNFNGGIWGRYQLSDRWSVQANVDYSPRGSQNIKLNYIDVPLTIAYNVRYKLFKMPMNFDVYAGVQPSFLTKATYIQDNLFGEGEFDVKPNIKNTNFDVVFGSGFPMWRFMFYATNKISLASPGRVDLANCPSCGSLGKLTDIKWAWSTEWFIGYRFGASNSFKPAPKD